MLVNLHGVMLLIIRTDSCGQSWWHIYNLQIPRYVRSHHENVLELEASRVLGWFD